MSLLNGRATTIKRGKIKEQIIKTLALIDEYFRARLGYVYLTLTFLTAGSTTIASKFLLSGRLNPYHILTYTSLIGIVIVFAFYYKYLKSKIMPSGINFILFLVISLVGFVVYELSFNIALENMMATQAIIIYYSNPIFIYFAGVLFLKDKRKKTIDKKVLIGLLICFSGVYFVLTGGRLSVLSLNKGALFILITVLSTTFFTIINKRMVISEIHFLLYGQVISLLCGIPILSSHKWWFMPNVSEIGILFFIAIVYNLLNLFFYIKTIQALPVEKLSTLLYISPVVTSVMSFIILKEPLSVSIVTGLVLVIAGNLLASQKWTQNR